MCLIEPVHAIRDTTYPIELLEIYTACVIEVSVAKNTAYHSPEIHLAQFLRNPTMSTKKAVNLEKSLADLEELVDELESGDLPLEKAMQKFEEGIKLTRACQTALKDAEQKVEILLKSADGDVLEDFEVEDD